MKKKKKVIEYRPVFDAGDLIVSEDREFRLIIKPIKWNELCGGYEFYNLTEHSIKDVFGNSIKFEKMGVSTQPADIVEKYFHLYNLK